MRRRTILTLLFLLAPSLGAAAEPRIVIFGQRSTPAGTIVVFDITTAAGREARVAELTRRGYQVYSGPAESDQASQAARPPMPVGPPIVSEPQYTLPGALSGGCESGNCPTTTERWRFRRR